MFDILKPAKVSVTDFAKIAGVSRVTVSQWVNGRMKPHRLHQSKIEKLISAIEQAVENKELPIPAGMEKTASLKRVKQVILKYVVEMKNTIKAGAE